MIQIKKRDGTLVPFNKQKIINAINKAMIEVDGQLYEDDTSNEIAQEIEDAMYKLDEEKATAVSVEDIQDMVEDELMQSERRDVAKAYILYRDERTRCRGNTTDNTINEIVKGKSDYWNKENSNKNPVIVTTQRDYIAGASSTDLARRKIFPRDIIAAHDDGIIHIHDMDYMAQNALTNCELINLEDMLQNGTVINEVLIEKPHRILTASTIATQIILAVTSSTYGGCTITLTHLAPFVRDSFILYLKESFKWIARPDNFLEEKINSGEWLGYNFIKENYPKSFAYAMDKTKKEIEDATQTFNYQVNSMTNTNGQAPFLSVFMYLNETDEYKDELSWLIEEFLKQRILGFKNKQGVYITPAFPKLLYVLEKDNINPKGKYYYLTKLAAECTAKRMVPDYISEKKMFELKGDCYPCMGCRSFLTPDPINHKYYGRFNAGVVSISLPDIALSSHKNYDKFWKIFDERLELCHKALQIRHHRIANITSDAAPILWQYGAFARLKAGESVKPLLYNNYSTLSLGYGGLYECVKYMTGYSHMEPEGKQFALDVMKHLNDKCNEWKLKENIAYSLYGTPMESLTYKIATNLKRKFPEEWKEMGDKNYITNSYHYPVTAEVDAFTKLADESEFQELSPGGAISYVEVPNMSNNIPAILEILSFIYDNIMYAELNCKFDYCQKCGYNGEMQIDENMNWYCPNCGNTDQTSMNIARRTCGYIGTNKWNYGRTQEIKERVLHLDN